MAAKESAVKSLEEEVTCPVCQEILNKPKKIPKKISCDHTFCLQCLQKMIWNNKDGLLACPLCRATSPLQESDANLYPTAHQVNRLIDIYHKTLMEHSQESLAPTEQPESPTCSLHNSQPLVLYCEMCQNTVCRDCALFLCAPKHHTYAFLKEIVKKYKNELDRRLKPLRELHQQIVDTTVAIGADNKVLEKQKRDEVEHIEAAFQFMSLKIEEQKTKLISEAQNSYDIQVSQNTSKVEELERALQSLSAAIQTTEDLDIAHSLTKFKSFLFQQTQHLQGLRFHYQQLLCYRRLCSEQNMQIDFSREFNPTHFFYYVGKGFKCYVSEYEKMKSLRVKKPFQIIFQLEEFRSEGKVKSKLVCTYDKSTVSVNVAKIAPNQISLTVTPQSRGKHELHILSGDFHIFGSPIPAYVFFEPQQLLPLKPTSLALDNATAITCHGNQVMVSSSPSSLTIFVNECQNLTVTKIIQCPGIAEFAVHDNFLFYSDVLQNRLVKSDMNGRIVASTGEKGSLPSQFKFPNGIRVINNQIFVCDTNNGRIKVYDTDLKLLKIIGEDGSGPRQFTGLYDLVFDEDGNMYVLESKNHRVQALNPQGDHLRFIGESYFSKPLSLAVYNEYLFCH